MRPRNRQKSQKTGEIDRTGYLVVKVLEVLPLVDLEELPRMADFAEVLAAMDLATGSASLEHYTEAQESVASDIVDTDSFLVELTSKIRARWSGTGKELYSLLQCPEGEKYWPEQRGMAGKLRRVAPDLRKAGWSVEEIESRLKGRAKTWVLTPPGGGGVPDTELVKVHMLMELHQQDLAAWERQLRLDGATLECMAAHASSASAGSDLLCKAPGCKASWRPEYQARVERSKVISSELLGALDKAGVDWNEVEQLIAERGLAVQ